MDTPIYHQLQSRRNARVCKRKFQIAALGKGVWDVFSGIYTAVACPDPKDYGLENAQADTTNKNVEDRTVDKDVNVDADKGKRKARTTLGPEEVTDFVKRAAQDNVDKRIGIHFNSRMTLYKFTLDEYDKGRKTIATAIAPLIS